jgi:hypothetical protein
VKDVRATQHHERAAYVINIQLVSTRCSALVCDACTGVSPCKGARVRQSSTPTHAGESAHYGTNNTQNVSVFTEKCCQVLKAAKVVPDHQYEFSIFFIYRDSARNGPEFPVYDTGTSFCS